MGLFYAQDFQNNTLSFLEYTNRFSTGYGCIHVNYCVLAAVLYKKQEIWKTIRDSGKPFSHYLRCWHYMLFVYDVHAVLYNASFCCWPAKPANAKCAFVHFSRSACSDPQSYGKLTNNMCAMQVNHIHTMANVTSFIVPKYPQNPKPNPE